MSRLKVVLAQDRTGLDEATLTKIRKEIQTVISKYVTITKSYYIPIGESHYFTYDTSN